MKAFIFVTILVSLSAFANYKGIVCKNEFGVKLDINHNIPNNLNKASVTLQWPGQGNQNPVNKSFQAPKILNTNLDVIGYEGKLDTDAKIIIYTKTGMADFRENDYTLPSQLSCVFKY